MVSPCNACIVWLSLQVIELATKACWSTCMHGSQEPLAIALLLCWFLSYSLPYRFLQVSSTCLVYKEDHLRPMLSGFLEAYVCTSITVLLTYAPNCFRQRSTAEICVCRFGLHMALYVMSELAGEK